MQNIAPIAALLVSSGLSLVSLPEPASASDGVDVSSWNVGAVTRIVYDWATVYVDATAAATLSGPVNIWGFRSTRNAWSKLGAINGAQDIIVPGPSGSIRRGFAWRIDEVGIFSRLLVACATVTGGVTYGYDFEPLAVRVD